MPIPPPFDETDTSHQPFSLLPDERLDSARRISFGEFAGVNAGMPKQLALGVMNHNTRNNKPAGRCRLPQQITETVAR